MNELKPFFIFGTRPECIKLAPLILEAKKKSLFYTICFTGQHREMIEPMLNFFEIKPDFDLAIMKSGQSLSDIHVQIVTKLKPILDQVKPSHIVVQGDTATAAIGAMVAFYEKIPVIHIEAGLRTQNLKSPWPEEFNRRLISLTSELHIAPTQSAAQNLLNEGINTSSIFVSGNTGIDALRLTCEKENILLQARARNLKEQLKIKVLVTLHRRESFGLEMSQIMSAIKNTMERFEQIHFYWPLHKNPKVRESFNNIFSDEHPRLKIMEPLAYVDFVNLMANSDFIVTDSGGLQEEAPFLGKPILICRKNTERAEVVQCGAAVLVGTEQLDIETQIAKLIDDEDHYKKMAQRRMPFGDGHASEKIWNYLLSK